MKVQLKLTITFIQCGNNALPMAQQRQRNHKAKATILPLTCTLQKHNIPHNKDHTLSFQSLSFIIKARLQLFLKQPTTMGEGGPLLNR